MRVMVLVKADEKTEAGVLPTEEILAAMGKYNEALVQAGVLVDGDGLQPTSKGVRVRFSPKGNVVIDGPFAETKELIAGYWIWKVESMADAIAWLKRAPFGDGEVEIRPFFEPDDFGEAYTPDCASRRRGFAPPPGRPEPVLSSGCT